jgi:hypothetical protein
MMNANLPVSPLKSKLVTELILAAAFCLTAAAQTSLNFADNELNFPTPGMPFQAEATSVPLSILAMEPSSSRRYTLPLHATTRADCGSYPTPSSLRITSNRTAFSIPSAGAS